MRYRKIIAGKRENAGRIIKTKQQRGTLVRVNSDARTLGNSGRTIMRRIESRFRP
jgi:hypothetical protein